MCDEFFTVEQDVLKQNLEGKKMVMNPPYEFPELFVLKLEDAKLQDDSTKAMLIIPEYKHRLWFKNMLIRDKWSIIHRFPRGSRLFSRPNSKDVFDASKRDERYWTQWAVLVLVLKDKNNNDPSLVQQHR